jgi:hypothetical protein
MGVSYTSEIHTSNQLDIEITPETEPHRTSNSVITARNRNIINDVMDRSLTGLLTRGFSHESFSSEFRQFMCGAPQTFLRNEGGTELWFWQTRIFVTYTYTWRRTLTNDRSANFKSKYSSHELTSEPPYVHASPKEFGYLFTISISTYCQLTGRNDGNCNNLQEFILYVGTSGLLWSLFQKDVRAGTLDSSISIIRLRQ